MKDITGQKFNRLTAIKPIHKDKNREWCWLFHCDCKNEITVPLRSVVHDYSKTKSCGCFNREQSSKRIKILSTTHGMNKTRFYRTWTGLRTRCNNPKEFAYKDYGGRGIKCLWKSFEEFRDDMYKSYLKHYKKFGGKNTTIDRIENDGNYCKENCRWSTFKQQARNRRKNHLLTLKGKTKCISEWTEQFGFSRGVISNRINNLNWSVEKSLTTPVKS